jgi:NAD(P)-dependent dehydrogenase (short-subunit alcohol dehydrogenase family)
MKIPGMRFDGQTVLVTGASSGIGRDTALAFAESGANVVLAARHTDKLRRIASEVRRHGVDALAATTDVTQLAQVRACFRKAVARFGGVDIVVNNAGVLVPASVVDIRRADLQKMLDVNLFGALYVMQEAVHHMRQRGRGSIVNVASLAGRRGIPPLGGYCATKFGLVGLTEALRTELASEDIHVSLVLPGVVETPMAARLQSGKDHEDFWPQSLNMPTSWVVAAIFAAARLRLAEVAVPPGAALIEKLAALAPGAADNFIVVLSKAARRAAARERR